MCATPASDLQQLWLCAQTGEDWNRYSLWITELNRPIVHLMSHTQEKKNIYIEIEDVTNHLRMEQKKRENSSHIWLITSRSRPRLTSKRRWRQFQLTVLVLLNWKSYSEILHALLNHNEWHSNAFKGDPALDVWAPLLWNFLPWRLSSANLVSPFYISLFFIFSFDQNKHALQIKQEQAFVIGLQAHTSVLWSDLYWWDDLMWQCLLKHNTIT